MDSLESTISYVRCVLQCIVWKTETMHMGIAVHNLVYK